MSVSNASVVAAWKKGKKARNGRNSFSTDGTWLYSYRLRIGYRTSNGICVVGDFTAGSNAFHSVTTSKHVGLAARNIARDFFWNPAVFQESTNNFIKDYWENIR